MMKNIIGLDLGTNSIGWAALRQEEEVLKGITALGSRIIPMDSGLLGDFERGNKVSQTAERTAYRGARRLREKHLLRRERLHRMLHTLGFLPAHYDAALGWDRTEGKTYGKFLDDSEPKIAWRTEDEGKIQFLFEDSFQEMLSLFKERCPETKKIPYDWTIYFLRKKALTEAITKEELAWLILHFNQKRGYYQLRGEDEQEEDKKKEVAFYVLKVKEVIDTNRKNGARTWYDVVLENDWVYHYPSNTCPDWVGKTKEFIVTTSLDESGKPKKDKEGNVMRSFRAPKEDDWTLVKKKTEHQICESQKTVGCFIFDALLEDPSQKIKGKLVRTIERRFYKEELKKILEVQTKFHAELNNGTLYEACLQELYMRNEAHKESLRNADFTRLIMDDIIFYQRPLKSKKSLIANCPYETKNKCIARSQPMFQEFRLWQFVANLKVYQREKYVDEKLKTDVDVTAEFLANADARVALFEWLNDLDKIDQKAFFKYKPFGLKKGEQTHRWNYVEDKSYPCNETRALMLKGLAKSGTPASFLTAEREQALWHLLYSVDDKHEVEKALASFASKHAALDKEAFVQVFMKFPSFKKEYGSYSAKAIRKLLPLMRMGTHWDVSMIHPDTFLRIQDLLDGVANEAFTDKVRERLGKAQEIYGLNQTNHFQGLPLWLACYVVYGRHSEASALTKWNTPADIDVFLKQFKQHSLHNPVVEQVVMETLRVLRDLWKELGSLDEIHVELGRSMKNPKDVRMKMAERNAMNENTNIRIKALLAELKNDPAIESVRPFSPSHQELLRIYEEGALNMLSAEDPAFEFVYKISRTALPTASELLRYKLWLEQKYCSPYTGQPIPLGKLFTSAYQVEHVIPKARFFDDSFNNKVICEAEVNALKSSLLGMEFINEHHGQIVTRTMGSEVVVLSVDAYQTFVKKHYGNNRIKMKNLLMEDIPDSFTERQMNDTRYISKYIMSLLSNIVREEGEEEAISKHVIACSGGITDQLKKNWGLHNVWNDIVYPRFERLNSLLNTDAFGFWDNKEKQHVFQTQMPLELQRGFSKKRIDHRHHAMDALVVACTTRNHINFYNHQSAKAKSDPIRYELKKSAEHKPWDSFTQEAREALKGIIVSFKQNLRVINKTVNCYQHYNEEGKKVYSKQTKGDAWAIRKPLHKETVYGNVNLQKKKPVSLSAAIDKAQFIADQRLRSKIKALFAEGLDKKKILFYFKKNAEEWTACNLSKVDVYYNTNDDPKTRLTAARKSLNDKFTAKYIEESITDTGIQKILLCHLAKHDGKPDLAFSPDGIVEMNSNIKELNGGKAHQPILKVRVYETQGNKFRVGENGCKTAKFVEAAKGTNLFFGIYQTKDGKRKYETIPLNIVVERQKQGLTSVPETNEEGDRLLYTLSPNDLVYLPTEEELVNGRVEFNRKDRIYKMVSSSGFQCFFIPHSISSSIVTPQELGSNNKAERAWTGEIIKESCLPIKVNRLGKIEP